MAAEKVRAVSISALELLKPTRPQKKLRDGKTPVVMVEAACTEVSPRFMEQT